MCLVTPMSVPNGDGIDIRILRSRTADVHDILNAGLRPADETELRALGCVPGMSLMRGLQGEECYSIVLDGKAVAMFGINPLPDDPRFGVVWLLGTTGLSKIRKQFVQMSSKVVDALAFGYDFIGNCVHERNLVHIRWLKWLGFSFLGRRGQFIEFARRAHV